MELFVCATYYQLLNAISIVVEYDLSADLIVVRKSIVENCDLDVLLSKGIFKKVYLWTDLMEKVTVEKDKNTLGFIKTSLKRSFVFFNKNNIWDSLPNRNQSYDKVHIGVVDSVTIWIYSWFKRSGATLSMYEDGTYSYACFSVKDSLFYRVAERALCGSSGKDECVQLYIKHPEMVDCPRKKIELLRFNNLDEDVLYDVLIPLYKLDCDSICCFEKRVIIFDEDYTQKELIDLQKGIAVNTVNTFGRENAFVKLHPSSRDDYYGGIIETLNKRIPFELVIPLIDIENKVLISLFSTACYTPKFDYDKEPYVIFTYKLANSEIIEKEFEKQIDELIRLYRNKEKVMIPETMEEYTGLLLKLNYNL